MRQSRTFAPLDELECRDSGAAAPEAYTIKGHAAVFNRPCDFGYFTEYVAPGAFASALSRKPLEVVSNWQHEDRWILAHTLNGSLELNEDEDGLQQWSRVDGRISYAKDARLAIEAGLVQQASICFRIGSETWEYLNEGEPDEEIRVTITDVPVLYDVTICALGAYPQTDVSVTSRARLDSALRRGAVPGLTFDDARERGIIGEADRGRPTPSSEEVAAAAARVRDDAAREAFLAKARAATHLARATVK
jgi:HK97 family phage prohead protease